MTTVCYDKANKTLGADTQITKDDAIYRGKKIFQVNKDCWVLTAGCVKNLEAAQAWHKANFDEEAVPDWTQGGDFVLLIIDKKGQRVRHLDTSGFVWEIHDDIVTAGSGGDYAHGALLAGASVETALRAAAAKDIHTSEPFDIITIP